MSNDDILFLKHSSRRTYFFTEVATTEHPHQQAISKMRFYKSLYHFFSLFHVRALSFWHTFLQILFVWSSNVNLMLLTTLRSSSLLLKLDFADYKHLSFTNTARCCIVRIDYYLRVTYKTEYIIYVHCLKIDPWGNCMHCWLLVSFVYVESSNGSVFMILNRNHAHQV